MLTSKYNVFLMFNFQKHTSNDFPDLSNSSMLRATSQLCATRGSGSFENSSRSATLFSSMRESE